MASVGLLSSAIEGLQPGFLYRLRVEGPLRNGRILVEACTLENVWLSYFSAGLVEHLAPEKSFRRGRVETVFTGSVSGSISPKP